MSKSSAPSATLSFVKTLGVRHRVATVMLGIGSHGLPLALAVVVVDLVQPRWTSAALVLAAVWLAGLAVWLGLRDRLPLVEADRGLGLHDRLVTFMRLDRLSRPPAAAFRSWLADQLDERLGTLSGREAAARPQRSLGAVRYLIPVVVLLLLLRTFAPLRPTWPAPGGPPLPTPNSGPGEAASPEPPPSGGDPTEPKNRSESEPETRPEAPVPPDPSPDLESALEPPTPLLDLPVVDVPVAPSFFSDGATRRDLARLAQLALGTAGAAPAPEALAPTESPEVPPADQAAYQRARERALHARRVPAHERGFVKAYFDLLVEHTR